MKRIITLVAFVLTTVTFAQQEIKEGVATTKMTMSSTDEQMNQQLAMMGDMNSTTYFKNNKSRTEMNNPMQGDMVTIVDNAANKVLVLTDSPMMGKKYMTSNIEKSEEELKDVTVTKTTDAKTFLGYECIKYNVVTKKQGVEVKMDVYVTEKLKALTNQTAAFGGKLKGYPLYTEMRMNQMGTEIIIKNEVTAVKATEVSDAKFEMTIPEGYTEQTQPGM